MRNDFAARRQVRRQGHRKAADRVDVGPRASCVSTAPGRSSQAPRHGHEVLAFASSIIQLVPGSIRFRTTSLASTKLDLPGATEVRLNRAERLLSVTFEDGHATGIYSWDLLHRLGRERGHRWRAYLQALEQAGVSR